MNWPAAHTLNPTPHLRDGTLLAFATCVLAACKEPDERMGVNPIDTATPAREVTPPLDSGAVPAPPPAAERRPHVVAAPHGATRQDEYHWLRDDDRARAEVLAYLEDENNYADAVMAPLADSKAVLYEELVGRIKQDDSSVPYKYKDYWYYTRFEEGQEYPIHARREGSMDAPEEVMLDVNQLADGHDFYQIGNWEISPNQTLLAYVEDTVGRRQYTLRVKDLSRGETLPVQIPGVSTSIAWAADNTTLYYVLNDETTLLTRWVKSHELGSEPSDDPIVYEEPDDSFYMGVSTTRSEKYICIHLESTVSSEMRCTETAAPGEFRVLAPRERDVEYAADHLGSRWVIRTNWNARNFKLMETGDDAWGDRARWRDLIPHDADVFIRNFELFDDFIAIGERSGGLARIRLMASDDRTRYVDSDETAWFMDLSVNAEPGTDRFRYTYTSMTTPSSTYELDVRTNERTLLKEQPVLGGFDRNHYVTERLWAKARDGARVPVSVLYRKGLARDGTAALLQTGYGSYGFSNDPRFNSNVLSLVDRGMVFALAHIRGGQEMGRSWYDDGKLLNKVNSFTDFIDVTDFLVAQGYAAADRIAAVGGSAGGLLVGAVANMAPEKYRVIVSQVPFVDVVTTMLDASIPLTTNEYDEWGNPEDETYYDYMLSYSPYDQLEAKEYPAMFVSTGLWDSQVQYWEPSKYVARLRARKTDDKLVVYRVQMEAGHGGRSGRFRRFEEVAEQYAFVLNQLAVGTGQ